MQIEIGWHTLMRAQERGASEAEIRDVLITGLPVPAKYGKMGKAKVYEFGRLRGGRHYEQKRVEVIYALEGDDLNTITVYVFYGKWE
jgi:hypothetical protein